MKWADSVYNKGMVAANDGNFSVKLNDHEFLCTPTGVSKGFMTPEFICKVDENANVLEANEGFRPSSEIKMHMRVYKERPDVKSVVHAHPMYATSFACCGMGLTEKIMPEAVLSLGEVPLAKYGTPSTDEIPDAVAEYLDYYDAVLLEKPWSFDLFRFPDECVFQDGITGVLCKTSVSGKNAWRPERTSGRTGTETLFYEKPVWTDRKTSCRQTEKIITKELKNGKERSVQDGKSEYTLCSGI